MDFLPSHLALLPALVAFLASLLLAMGAAAWFTTRLELLCDLFGFSPSMLSLLGALGANIPNYIASIVAIAGKAFTVGLGIIVGSNIYNLTIILGLSILLAPNRAGIRLSLHDAQEVTAGGRYTLLITLTTLLSIALLTLPTLIGHTTSLSLFVIIPLLLASIAALLLFVLLSRRAIIPGSQVEIGQQPDMVKTAYKSPQRHILLIIEVLLALSLALVGVVVMVQSGQELATDTRMSPVILGLVLLAIATSLPNTVVAVSLARQGRAITSLEEVLNSNSINATLGIALPLLFWHGLLSDSLLLLLDVPLMMLLTVVVLLFLRRHRISLLQAVLLLLVYIVWIGIHLAL